MGIRLLSICLTFSKTFKIDSTKYFTLSLFENRWICMAKQIDNIINQSALDYYFIRWYNERSKIYSLNFTAQKWIGKLRTTEIIVLFRVWWVLFIFKYGLQSTKIYLLKSLKNNRGYMLDRIYLIFKILFGNRLIGIR